MKNKEEEFESKEKNNDRSEYEPESKLVEESDENFSDFENDDILFESRTFQKKNNKIPMICISLTMEKEGRRAGDGQQCKKSKTFKNPEDQETGKKRNERIKCVRV